MKIETRSMPYGFMCWWNKCEEAAKYTVKLFIGQEKDSKRDISKGVFKDKKAIEYQLLCEVTKDRQTFYHTFQGLADIAYQDKYRWVNRWEYDNCNRSSNINYFVEVVAEDRLGNGISKSDKVIVKVS